MSLHAQIQGTVIDHAGQPVEGALLQVVSGDRGEVLATVTDEKGFYSFGEVEPGEVEVEVWRQDYHKTLEHLRLSPGETITLNFGLRPLEAKIQGYVKTWEGVGIAGAVVEIGGCVAVTDDGGYYAIELPGGVYDIEITKQGYQGTRQGPVELRGGASKRLDFALLPLKERQQEVTEAAEAEEQKEPPKPIQQPVQPRGSMPAKPRRVKIHY